MSGSGNGSASDWFRDPESLVAVARRARPSRAAPPSIPGYDDVRELHRGGQGVVYSATQRSTKRRVAVKVLLDGALASDAARRRFEREVDLVAGLRHPHIVSVYDSGRTEGGQPFLVMELIDGAPLDEWDAGAAGDEAVRRRLGVFQKVCVAVSHAHQRGVIHRDLKPSNIRVDAAGEPHVLDFGLAKVEGPTPAGATVTESGRFVGSLPWASPEQAKGDQQGVDTRSDIYSLGVILFQLVTGRFPYDVQSGLRSALENIITAEPQRPSSIVPGAAGDLETIVLRCLAKDPARRYQSAAELADDIGRFFAGEPIAARRDSAWEALRRRARRYRAAAIAAGLVVVIAGAALAVSVAYWKKADTARRSAAAALERAERQTRRAESTSKYLQRALQSPDSNKQGRDVRVADILDQAAGDAGSTLADQPDTLVEVRVMLAHTYYGLAMFEPGVAQAEAALEIARRTEGEESSGAVFAGSALALGRERQGRLDEAEQMDRRLMALAARVLGPLDRETLTITSNLTSVLALEGRYAESEALCRELLPKRVAALGATDRDTLSTMSRIGRMLDRQGKFKEAREQVERVLEQRIRSLGEEDSDTIASMTDLAGIMQNMGDASGAEALYARAADLSAKVNGPEHAITLIILNNRCTALLRLNRVKEAEDILRPLIGTLRRVRGPEHDDVLTAMNGLASALRKEGKADEAEPILREVIEIARRTIGPTHPNTLSYENTLATTLLALKRPDEAVVIMEQVWAGAKERLGESHPRTCLFRGNLARALASVKRFEEAAAHATGEYETIAAAMGKDSLQAAEAITDVVQVYRAWGKPDEAAAWQARLPAPPK